MVSICNSILVKDVKHLFMHLLALYVFSLLCPFFNQVVCFFCLFFAFIFWLHDMWKESLFPNQGSNPYLVKHRVFIPGPPGKSTFFGFFIIELWNIHILQTLHQICELKIFSLSRIFCLKSVFHLARIFHFDEFWFIKFLFYRQRFWCHIKEFFA